MLVSGEAGIGKTSLCERAGDRAERDGMTVIWGRCWPHGGAPPMWPWPKILADLLGAEARQLLAGDDDSSSVSPERFARFTEIAGRIGVACASSPTLVVLDDAHKAGGGALMLTRFLVRALDRVPLALLLTRRSDPAAGRGVETLLDELAADAAELSLQRFDLRDTLGYLGAHGVDDVDSGLARTLLHITGGNPLLLSRAVARSDPSPHGQARLETAIGDAIDRLPTRCGRMLGVLALLGLSASLPEVAALAECTSTDVLDTLGAAEQAGLVRLTPHGMAELTHDLVRQAASGRLPPAERCTAHARAAALLRGDGRPAQLARRAHHALAASGRSVADAAEAVDACRVAARALASGLDYEDAAALLTEGAEVAESASGIDPGARAAVLVEAAEALLACGRLVDSRTAFDTALLAAQAAGDPALVARAALGLGGMWVNEHRSAVDRSRVLFAQRAALEQLPENERVLRARLRVRLAAEAVYSGAAADDTLAELAAVRALGDPSALADALSLTHHALLAPEYARTRLALAEELIALASAQGDGVLALFGLLWRTVDLYQLGDHAAERCLAELRDRADALRCRHVLFIVEAIDVMRLIRQGELAEAEQAAQSCFQSGLDVGDADATAYYAGQLLTIRWIQGRDDELLADARDAAASPTLVAAEFALRASVAMTAARAGRQHEARAVLAQLTVGGLGELPGSSTWLTGIAAVIEAAALLGHPATAREAACLLEPFADLPVMPSLAISCLGSAHRPLGVAAMTCGDHDLAVTRFQAALEANQRIGNRPVAALSRADLATALIARGKPGDAAWARELLAEAHAEAVAMELPVRAAAWSGQLDALAMRRELKACLSQRADRWTLTIGGREQRLPDLVGLDYLAALVAHPGQDLSAIDLCLAGTVERDRQGLLDTTALDQYRARVSELDGELTAAGADGDRARAEGLHLEREALLAELSSATGLGGRIRSFGNSPERARTAVRKAIKRALACITEADNELGTQLTRAVHTGNVCRYDPDPTATHWKVVRQ